MAQTDSRAGFRLPWSSERSTTESSDGAETVAEETSGESHQAETAGQPVQTATDTIAATGAGDEDGVEPSAASGPVPSGAAEKPAPVSPRKPSKFLADLTRAMQAAAEDARNATLAQVKADAKAHVEQIHERSTSEAAALRRAADDDVAAVREWSKAEIARIREETDNQITARKGRLESEIESHAAGIEREIERVHGHVVSFEEEMAAFFERLLAEEDPSRFATMAERLPEPPPFEAMSTPAAPIEADPQTDARPTDEAAAAVVDAADAVADRDAGAAPGGASELSVDDPAQVGLGRDAASPAGEAATEAAATADVATTAAERPALAADVATAEGGTDAGDGVDRSSWSADFDAAEAEAAASADEFGDADEIPVIGDDALAARLADLLPAGNASDSTESRTTQVIVTGLVSVASIASFKRHLGRLAGVTSVGVSSGPDGEFLFSVQHTTDIVLGDAIPSLPSFQARVTGADDGTLNVTAHDPESDG